MIKKLYFFEKAKSEYSGQNQEAERPFSILQLFFAIHERLSTSEYWHVAGMIPFVLQRNIHIVILDKQK